MKPIFLKIGIAIIFIVGLLYGCSKDRELAELSWTFDVETPNKDIDIGLEVGQEVDLTYIVKKNYETGANISYEIVTTTTNFSVINEQNENIQLNKEYSIDKDTLRLKYRGLDRGEQEFKILFKNTKGHQIEKKLRFNFDGFGFIISPLSEKFLLGNVVKLNYTLSSFENKTTTYNVKVVEDESEGEFRLSKDGTAIAKKGESFELINTASEDNFIYYYTKNYTKEGKEFDKIVLEITPQKGNSHQKQTVTLNYKFEKPNIFFKVEKANVNSDELEYKVIINDVQREDNKYLFVPKIGNYVEIPDWKQYFFFPSKIKIVYKDKEYENQGKIYFEGIGEHLIRLIPDEEISGKVVFESELTYLEIYKNNSKIDIDFSNIWSYPKLDFVFKSEKTGGWEVKNSFKATRIALKGNKSDYKLNIIVEPDYDSKNNRREVELNFSNIVENPSSFEEIFNNQVVSFCAIYIKVLYKDKIVLSKNFSLKKDSTVNIYSSDFLKH